MFLLFEVINLEKYFEDRLILNVKNFKMHRGDKIGFVGNNGLGKSTFMDILAGEIACDSGKINTTCTYSYIKQFDKDKHFANRHMLSKFNVLGITDESVASGGEKARIKIAQAFSDEFHVLLADEPTSNLDKVGIEEFCKVLMCLESYIIISHDRHILNNFCDKIMTIKNGDIIIYNGNFDEYQEQADKEQQYMANEYDKYISEKRRLQGVYELKKKKASKITKKPKNISNSDAKAHSVSTSTRSYEGKQKSMESSAKNILSRIDKMQEKESPQTTQKIKLNFATTNPPRGKVLISSENLTFGHNSSKLLFKAATFSIYNGSKVALCGENGAGKTTLLNLIYNNHPEIYIAPKTKIGYLRQDFSNLDYQKTVLRNVLDESVQTEAISRSILAQLLFFKNDINKPAGVLSGGEKIKLILAKLLVSDVNFLILDEVTNYLDINSLNAIESMIIDYEGTILLTSHDKTFIDKVSSDIITIENCELKVNENKI